MAKNKKPVANQPTLPEQLDNWVFYGFLAIAVALPLVMSRPLWVTFDQFDITKILFLRLLTLFTMVLWVGKMFSSKRQEVRWSKLDFMVLGFLLLVIISTFTSIHLPTAVHGKYKRYEGLLTFLNYGILYFLALQTFTNARRLSRLGTAITLAGALVAIYGVAQYMGYDPLPWAKLPFEERRAFSTFGNPDLLAGFLVILMPIVVAEFFRTKQIKDKTGRLAYDGFIFICYALSLASFLFALTRGAWIGGLVALIAFVAVTAGAIRKHPVKAILVFGVFIIAFAAVASYTAATSHGTLNLIERIQSVTKLDEGSAGSRLEIWKSGVQAIKAKPVFGWGPDMFRLASERYETLKYTKMTGGMTVADNAHDYVIQLASGVGIPATLILLVFFAVVIFLGAKRTLKLPEDERFVHAGLTTAVLGYCVHLLFGISISGSTSVFWILLGALVATSASIHTLQVVPKATGDAALKAAMAVLVFISLVSAYYGVRMFGADQHYARAIQLGNNGDFQGAISEYDQAIALYQNGRYYDSYGLFLERVGVAQQSSGMINGAVKVYQAGKDWEPYDMDHYVSLASALTRIASRPNDQMLIDAESALEYSLKEVRPNSVSGHLLLGNIYFVRGKYKEAIGALKFAHDIKPDDPTSVRLIAKAYERLGNKKQAKLYYEKVLALQPDNNEAKQAIASLHP